MCNDLVRTTGNYNLIRRDAIEVDQYPDKINRGGDLYLSLRNKQLTRIPLSFTLVADMTDRTPNLSTALTSLAHNG